MAVSIEEGNILDDVIDPVAPDAEKILVNCSSVKGRIELIRQERDMSKAAFAKSIGLTPQGYQFVIKNDCKRNGFLALETTFFSFLCVLSIVW